MFDRLADASDDVLIVDLDREFASAIETAGCQIDGAYDGAFVIREKQLRVQLYVSELMNFDAEILKAAKTADPFYELCSLSFCGGRAMM